MDIKGITASTKYIILTLALLMGAIQVSSALTPDCTFLQPASCTTEPVLDDSDQVSYNAYIESCPNHICIALKPTFPPTVTGNTSHFSLKDAAGNQRLPPGSNSYAFPGRSTSPPGRVHSAAFVRSSPALTSISSTSEKFVPTNYNPNNPWFCSALQINYTARVEANTGLPPGYKEDMYAQCLYQRLEDAQSLGDCRMMRYGCNDCKDYYRNWLCAIAFPKCDPAQTVTTYPVYNASSPNVGSAGLVPSKIFSITKPCRALCFGVVQTCQAFMNFNCPLYDTRDYADYPDCNALGLDQGSNPYAKSIFR